MPSSFPLSPEQLSALRFLVMAREASQSNLAAAAANNHSLFGGMGLQNIYGLAYFSVAGDLVALGLATAEGGVYVPTPRGDRALQYLDSQAQHDSAAALPAEPRVIMGYPREPVFYSEVLAEFVDKADVLFVDRYLAVVDLETVSKISSVARVLTGAAPVVDRKEKNARARLEKMRLAAGARPGLQVRLSSQIHDRYMLPSSGRGLILGASLGGAKLTTVVELSEEATADIRRHHEKLWLAARIVDPIAAPQAVKKLATPECESL